MKVDNIFNIVDKKYSFTCIHPELTKQMIDFFNEANIYYDYKDHKFFVDDKHKFITKSKFNYFRNKLHDNMVYGIKKYYWEV